MTLAETLRCEEKGPLTEEVAAWCIDSVIEVAHDERAAGTRERFMRAFDERRRYPWLPEAGKLTSVAPPGAELTYALAHALAIYEPAHDRNVARYAPATSGYADERSGDLAEAAKRLTQFPYELSDFASEISRALEEPDKLQHRTVVKHVRQALEYYARVAIRQVSADPW